ncbi:MAG: hypothetical protein V1694_00040, partial [Candidatus Eisenbacteria bacterium]
MPKPRIIRLLIKKVRKFNVFHKWFPKALLCFPINIFITHSWPRAILHVDGDAFFTSCEEALHPELRGKPIITGGERGIVACASYAAKQLGIKRGVPLREAKRICPSLVVLPSDYETYSLFS